MQVQENYRLIEVPKIGAPFPVDEGPQAEEAQRKHMEWADEQGVFRSKEERQRFALMNIGALADLLYPEASGSGDLQLVADWCAWLLLRDDRWDATEDPNEWEHLARRNRAYLRLMRQTPGRERNYPASEAYDEDDTLYGALADLCTRLRERARREDLPEPVDRRLVSVMKAFFFASVQQTAYQHRGVIPALCDYVSMRPVTGGLDILTFVLATLDGVRLPKGLFDEPDIRRLTDVTHNICCWHNDLVSLNKELTSGEVHNLILVLQYDPESDCQSLPEAVDAAVGMIREELRTFAELEREVLALGRPRAQAAAWYARMLRNRVDGIIVWQEACAARYGEAAASTLGS